MTFDFRQISGAEDSKQENFSSLCSRLLLKIYPDAKPVEGKGGDQGLDTFIGLFNGKCRAFQHKFFLEKVGPSQRKQIEKSLVEAITNHQVIDWTLMLPKELNPTEISWFQKLQKKYPKVKLDWWGKTKLQELLALHPDISKDFQPMPSIIINLGKDNIDIKNTSTETIAKAINDALGRLGDATRPQEIILAAAEEIRSRSKLRVLILGPDVSGGDIYDKRCQIRQLIRNCGHEADFFEDILTPLALESSGLNIGVEELVRAKGYDYIVCLMSSPGTISEFHLFAHRKELAVKMMTCIDEQHKSGFISQSMVRIYEGFHGKLDWFLYPEDINKCHLANRVLEQIQKVQEMKQWVLVNRSS